MESEKICPFMSRPSDKNSTGGFIPCQKELCMAWVPEFRMAPVGIIHAHCKLLGLEGDLVSRKAGGKGSDQYPYLQGLD